MIETVVAVVGSLTAFGALVVSYKSHRHEVRRSALLDQREDRIELRERRLEQRERATERAAEREAARSQASLIMVHVSVRRSSLDERASITEAEIANRSNQPIVKVQLIYEDQRHPDTVPWIGPSSAHALTLPGSWRAQGHGWLEVHLRSEFTDASGIRWSRDSTGGLRQGTEDEDGVWQWGPREPPVFIAPAPGSIEAYGRVASAASPGCLATAAVALAILAWVQWLIMR